MAAQQPPRIEWVPFVTGRRPVDEAAFPGLGSSDNVALILDSNPAAENTAYLLYRVTNLPDPDEWHGYEVRASVTAPDPVPECSDRLVRPTVFELDAQGRPALREIPPPEAGGRCLILPMNPATDFGIRSLTLEHLFMRRVRVEVVLRRDGTAISSAQIEIDVCDARNVGSLYRRVMERVIAADTEAQARLHGLAPLGVECHPWFPVLLIGAEKANLYMRAVIADIVHKQRYLTDPSWLMRLGVYLELVTCHGIFEAVKEDVGDALSREEREAYESAPALAPIRNAVDVERWRRVWALRHIAMPANGTRRTGKIATLNLLAKKRATLAFLEAHHHDLRQAISLAGPNEHNAQETWHRVFRDAERAVLRKTAAAFAELETLPAKAQEFVLWHRKGFGGATLAAVSSWFGDQDGLYAVACDQYRHSMNEVAAWAKARGFIDYSGSECIPESVSLLRTMMDGKQQTLRELQRRDGYEPLDLSLVPTREAILGRLRGIPIFSILTDEELDQLAATVRPIELGPVERVIVQGRRGNSLFIVADGTLEVMVRQKDGVDLRVGVLEAGAVFGEMSLLTGQPRRATVRSIGAAVVYEIGHQQFAPILRSRPSAVYDLAAIMASRLEMTMLAGDRYEAKKKIGSLSRRIRTFLLLPSPARQAT